MAKGTESKNKIAAKIKEIFGNDYAGTDGTKHYIWCMENGERIQIAISMTCPKTMFGEQSVTTTAVNSPSAFDLDAPNYQRAEITPEETERLATMLAKLGL